MEETHPNTNEAVNVNTDPAAYFDADANSLHRKYLALRMFFKEGYSAEQVAAEYGYTTATVYSLVRDFKEKLNNSNEDPFFKEIKNGRPKTDLGGEIKKLVVGYRKKYLSVPEIKAALDAQNINVSEKYVWFVLQSEGFARLPRREKKVRNRVVLEDKSEPCVALKSEALRQKKDENDEPQTDEFSSQLAGLLLFLPIIKSYGIDKLIEASDYPETLVINRLSSILSYLALKLSNIERYSMDDAWCMDRGMGLFAGLNVLPKTAWFSSYSSSVTRAMNVSFLHSLCQLWRDNGLLSDTINLDFTAIPYWGDSDPFENNWSGKRTKALASIQAVLAQDPDSGLLCYSDTTIRHSNESDVVLEFLDFYHNDPKISSNLKYLVFDSRFTTYQNLNTINKKGLTFITIQRRCKKLDDKAADISASDWKKIRVPRANGKGRIVFACEDLDKVKGYDAILRQVFIKGVGKINPAIIITNDFDISLESLVRKYGKRWLVEKDISEQIHFFHLNRNCSGIVVKVDFDLVMTLLAHNLYRLFAQHMDGYSHCEAKTLFNKFILNAGEIVISENAIDVKLKRKRTLPMSLEYLTEFDHLPFHWLDDKILHISAATFT